MKPEKSPSVPTESRQTLVTVLMTHCHQKYYSRSGCTCGWGTTLTTAEQGYREWVDHIAETYAASSSLLPVPDVAFYVASRASIPARSEMWRDLRSRGMNIVSSWIDEAGEGETESFEELWQRIYREIQSSTALILYAEQGDFPLKGALIEVGIALGMGKPVMLSLPGVVLEGRTYKPLGSWIEHPGVTRLSTSLEAFCYKTPAPNHLASLPVGESRWISVKEKLPEQSDMYLVAAKPSAPNNVSTAIDVFSAVWESACEHTFFANYYDRTHRVCPKCGRFEVLTEYNSIRANDKPPESGLG